MKLYIFLICCETWLEVWKFSIKTCWSSHCRLCELQDIGVDMETDIGEVLLPTESWDVTAYLPEDREQRNHNVTLILQCYFLFSLFKEKKSVVLLFAYLYVFIYNTFARTSKQCHIISVLSIFIRLHPNSKCTRLLLLYSGALNVEVC